MACRNRREFLRSGAFGLSAAGLLLATRKLFAAFQGANERIRIAVAGINSRGMEHIKNYCSLPDVEVAYLVDPDSRLFAMRSKWIEERTGKKPQCVQDLRRVLDDREVDAVSIASTNHWHSLQTIWACQAGKDVYVEKPCSHNIFEGRKLVEAARKYQRIVQHGTQSRSDPYWQAVVSAVRSGRYGKLLVAYGFASKPRRSIGFRWPKQPPAELDFDIWLGPAPQQPYHENLVHYNWHWFWDFGNGEIGNQGVHQMDIARWAMPEGAVPQSVISLGGRYGYQPQDQGQTPNTQLTIIDFGGPKIIFEDRGLVDAKTAKVDNEFLTTEGVIRHGRFFPKGKDQGEPLPELQGLQAPQVVTLRGNVEQPSDKKQPVKDPQALHFANFIASLRTRKNEQLNAEISEGHLSSRLCHLGNLSYRLGKEVPLTREPEELSGDEAAMAAFLSMKEHLVEVAGLQLEKTAYRLGKMLKFNAADDRFIDDSEADALLARPYRSLYVVPEEV